MLSTVWWELKFRGELAYLSASSYSVATEILGVRRLRKSEVLFARNRNSGRQLRLKRGLFVGRNYSSRQQLPPKYDLIGGKIAFLGDSFQNMRKVLCSQGQNSGRKLPLEIRGVLRLEPRIPAKCNVLACAVLFSRNQSAGQR